MKILKARLSHATNSSSTHSLLLVDPGKVPRCTSDGNEFGWENFTASSDEAKETYFGVMLYQSLCSSIGEDAAKIITTAVLQGVTADDVSEGYIDHQSFKMMPMDWGGKMPDLEFARDLREYLLRDDIAILGGNDNSDGHPLADLSHEMPGCGMNAVCRKDPQGYWAVFNRLSGGKVRFSLADPKTSITHSQYPELIDIKLTDFCGKGCRYCYQGSTPKGEHASVHDLGSIANLCGEMKVFEVALGGGEPVDHPDFITILEYFRNAGVVPSFSTRNLSWLDSSSNAAKISDLCGAWALSSDNSEDIEKAVAASTYLGIKKPAIHVVLDANSKWTFERILKTCKKHSLRVVLLGFKETGRGKDARREDNSHWLSVVKGLNLHVSIDTSVAREYANQIKDAGIPEYLIERKEGCFSMYIDAVSKTMGPSSFCDKSEMVEIGSTYSAAGRIEKSLKRWSGE